MGGATFDALIFGYCEGGEVIYAARTRNGFTPELRAELMNRCKPLETGECPFANPPEKKAGPPGRRTDYGKDGRIPMVKAGLVGQFGRTSSAQPVHWVTQDKKAKMWGGNARDLKKNHVEAVRHSNTPGRQRYGGGIRPSPKLWRFSWVVQQFSTTSGMQRPGGEREIRLFYMM